MPERPSDNAPARSPDPALLPGTEQTLADSDQTLSDADQTGSDGDQTNADRDQWAADRDQAASDHDLAYGVNPEAHEFSREIRERSALQRAHTAHARLDGADKRDEIAHARDVAAKGRDQATQRKRDAQHRTQAAGHRSLAAQDRRAAARDREQAAGERLRALVDRETFARQLAISTRDPLTGARTRAAGLSDLDRELDRARRSTGELVVAYVDVVGLKALNDGEGHGAGDELLKRVVALIRRHLRSYDLIVRIGGHEFLCAMSDMTLTDARRRLSAIAEALAATPGGGAIGAGLAQLAPGDTATELIARADSELIGARGARHEPQPVDDPTANGTR